MYKIYCSYSELHNITSFFFYSWHLSAFVFLASKWKHDIIFKIRIVFVNPPKQIERELLNIKDYSRGNIALHTDQELSYIANLRRNLKPWANCQTTEVTSIYYYQQQKTKTTENGEQ